MTISFTTSVCFLVSIVLLIDFNIRQVEAEFKSPIVSKQVRSIYLFIMISTFMSAYPSIRPVLDQGSIQKPCEQPRGNFHISYQVLLGKPVHQGKGVLKKFRILSTQLLNVPQLQFLSTFHHYSKWGINVLYISAKRVLPKNFFLQT